MTIAQLASRLGVSDTYLRSVVAGYCAPSESLATALTDTLGSDWRFVIGATNVLRALSGETLPGHGKRSIRGETLPGHGNRSIRGDVRGPVIDWISRAIVKTSWALPYAKHPGIQIGRGRIYLNASFIQNSWEEVLDVDRPPSLKKIGQVLKALTGPDPKTGKHERRLPLGYGRADFHCLEPQRVYDAAIDLQVGTIESNRALIEVKLAYHDALPPAEPGGTGRGLFADLDVPEPAGKIVK